MLAAVEQPRHPQPQPPRPGHTRAAQHAQLGGVERRRDGVGVGVERARHDERGVQPRRGPAAQKRIRRRGRVVQTRPDLHPGQLPVAAHRLGQGAQQVVDRAAPSGVLGEVAEQLVRGAADRVHRGAGAPGRPARERSGARRGDDDRDRRGPHDPALGTGREPAEQEQQRDQPEQHRRADRRHRRGGDQHPDARPAGLRARPGGEPGQHGEARECRHDTRCERGTEELDGGAEHADRDGDE